MKPKFKEAYLTISPDGCNLFDISSNYKEFWDCHYQELEHNPIRCLDFIAPKEKNRVLKAWNDLFLIGKSFQEEYQSFQEKSNNKNQSSLIQISSFPFRQSGNLLGYTIVFREIQRQEIDSDSLVTGTDISKPDPSKSNLIKTENFLEPIINSAVEIIWVLEKTKNNDFTIIKINKTIEKFFDLPFNWWLGKTLRESFINQKILDIFEANCQVCLEQDLPIIFEKKLKIKNKHKSFLFTFSPLSVNEISSSQPSRILVIALDISYKNEIQKTITELEKQREITRSQLNFFSMASHEFRTPLSTILVLTQSLILSLDRSSKARILKKLQELEKVAKKLSNILDKVLTINRLESQSNQKQSTLSDPEKICTSIIQEMQILAGKNRKIFFIKLKRNYSNLVNSNLFKQILSNLLANAIKYSPKDRDIHVILQYQLNQTILIVKDRGKGIIHSDIPLVFEPFHRGQNIEKIPGSGLGLALVKKCVDFHKGSIQVKSVPNKGSTFTVILPDLSIENL